VGGMVRKEGQGRRQGALFRGQGRQAGPIGGGVGDERMGFEDRDREKWFDPMVT
jgi:hypothetical protein